MQDDIPGEVIDERSGVHFIPIRPTPPPAPGTERIWKWAALVLTTLVAAGGLLGVFGRAFYVSRVEYTEQQRTDAVARESMRGTLERLDKTLQAQADAFHQMTSKVEDMKVDLAVLQKSR